MKEEAKIGIFLCECGGKISNRISLPRVNELLNYEPWAHLGIHPYPCLSPGLEAMKTKVRNKGINRVLIGGCSPRAMKKKFTEALAPLGIEPHQVEMVNLRDHVAAVHEGTPQELAQKAAALLAGGLAGLELLEPYDPVSVPFQGPVLIMGGGISGFAAARELARKGMECRLFSTALTPEQVLAELPRTFPGSRIFSGELAELLREVFTSPLIQVVPDQPVEYVVGHVGDYRLGLRQPDGQRTEVIGSALIMALDREFVPGDYDYIGGGDKVCDLLEMEECLAQGKIKPGKVLFWVNSPEHGQAAQEFATMAAWRNSLVMARNYPEAKPTVLYPSNITLPLTGGDLAEARECGVGLQSYAPEVHPVVQSGYMTYFSSQDHLEHELEWDNLVVSMVPGDPVPKTEELLRWLPVYREDGGKLRKTKMKLRPEQVADETIFLTGSAGEFQDLNEVLQQGKKAARGVLHLREKAQRGALVSPVVVTIDQDLCEGCGLCSEICPCGGVQHHKPGSGPVPHEADSHLCHGGGTCAATCPYEAIKMLNNTAQQLEARVKAVLARMQEHESLGFICSWGGLGAADLAGVKGLSYSRGVYLIPVNCLGSIDPAIFSMAFVNGANSILLAGCTPHASCHYVYGVDHSWYRVNVMKKLLTLAGLERKRITMGYVDVNQPDAFVGMVESHLDKMQQLAPINRDESTKTKLWAIHATLHRPRVRWVLGTSLRRPTEKEFPGEQVNAVDADETMLDVLREEYLASRILRSIHDRPLSPPQIARDMDEPVKKITPMLTDMAKEGRIAIRGWEGGYPVYATGKA
jgi:coenzyme F420-reducing hydrogenase delta subunit/NAD-dependent dihydropyrimidine dehydrogenase PreA subunit